MADKYLKQLSGLTGLACCPKQGPFGQSEGAVIGNKNGYLVAIGPAKDDQGKSSIRVMVAYPEHPDVGRLRQALLNSSSLALALEVDKVSEKHLKKVAIDGHGINWPLEYSFGKPKAEKVVRLMGALIETLKGVAPAYQGKCESCNQSSVSEIMLVNGLVPTYICSGCQMKAQGQVDEAAREYQAIEPDLMKGLLYAFPVALGLSLAWGLIAFSIHRIFLWGGVIIGVAVTKALLKGMGRINLAGQACVGLLTVSSVMLGDAIFYVLTIMKQENLPFSARLVSGVLSNFMAIEMKNGILSILVALGGAAYVLYAVARQPKFAVEYVPLKPEPIG